METMFGYAPALILDSAAACGIFEALAQGGRTSAEVAEACSVTPRGAAILLNALVGLEWLTKSGEAYMLTEESAALLLKGSPGYHGGMLWHIVRRLLPAWQSLETTLRTGKPAVPLNIEGEGGGCFRDFVAALYCANYPAARTLAGALPAVREQRDLKVLDVAAGSGVWGIALALASPKVHVTALDWQAVVPVTRNTAEQTGVADRFDFIGGDVHEADWGSGYDLIVLGHLLHTQGETLSRSLLRKAREALAPGGTVVVAEVLVNEDRTGPAMPLIFAVNMLVTTDIGDTYSLSEITSWLADAGYGNIRTLDVPGSSPLILADK
jgi:2-polyprenyl-3-methyl-5-hydroxy-6-metoxy-1,4-benzoquinol methylase